MRDVGGEVGHAARRLRGRPQALDASLEVRGGALALVVDRLRQHEVRPRHGACSTNGATATTCLDLRQRHLPAVAVRPLGGRVDAEQHERPHLAGLDRREQLVAAAGEAAHAGAALVRAGGQRQHAAPLVRGRGRARRPRSRAVSTGSVTISTGCSAPGQRARVARRGRRAPRRCAPAGLGRRLPASRSSARAAGPDDHQVRAAPARLADPQLERAGAVGDVGVADDHDHVGAVEVVDPRRVRVEQLPGALGRDGPGGRPRAAARARCGPRRRPPRW